MKNVGIGLKKKTAFQKRNLKKHLPYAHLIPDLVPFIFDSVDKKTIQKIYLFGSYAYGKPDAESDLDIAVIVDNIENSSEIYLKIWKKFIYNKIVCFDLIVYKENEFYNGKNKESVEYTIMEKGKILYER